jgi:hypothetical protein
MIKTPSNLEFLLHCYYSPEPHDRVKAPAIEEARSYLLEQEMIQTTTSNFVYNVTPRGEAYIKYILEVPFPERCWVMPAAAEARLFDGQSSD